MATPPLRTDLADTYPNPSNFTFKTGIGKFWDYVTTLLGASGSPSDARTALQVDRGNTFAVATGTVNAILVAFSPAFTSIPDGQEIKIRCVGSGNTTTTPTIKVDSLVAVNIYDRSGNDVTAGVLVGEVVLRYHLSTTSWRLMSQKFPTTMTNTVGGLVPTPPNDADKFLRGDATFAVPPQGGMDLLSTTSTASGSTITVSGYDLSSYERLYIRCSNISSSNNSAIFRLGGVEAATLGASSTSSGILIEFDLGIGLGKAGGRVDGAAGNSWSATDLVFPYRKNSTSLVFSLASGNTFDGGVITVYGIK